jgi:hypothetical protein
MGSMISMFLMILWEGYADNQSIEDFTVLTTS